MLIEQVQSAQAMLRSYVETGQRRPPITRDSSVNSEPAQVHVKSACTWMSEDNRIHYLQTMYRKCQVLTEEVWSRKDSQSSRQTGYTIYDWNTDVAVFPRTQIHNAKFNSVAFLSLCCWQRSLTCFLMSFLHRKKRCNLCHLGIPHNNLKLNISLYIDMCVPVLQYWWAVDTRGIGWGWKEGRREFGGGEGDWEAEETKWCTESTLEETERKNKAADQWQPEVL